MDTKRMRISSIEELFRAARKSGVLGLMEMETAPGCPDEAAFLRFLSGTSSRREERKIQKHLIVCMSCMSTSAELAPFFREKASPERTRAPEPKRAGRWARGWRVGLGGAGLALCSLLVFMIVSAPVTQMQLVHDQQMVRSASVMSDGDQFHLEVSSAKDGYVYVYAWNAQEGGQFIYPEPGEADKNAVKKGELRSLPSEDRPWTVSVTAPGEEETLFLLFSAEPVSKARLGVLSNTLAGSTHTKAEIERELEKHFSVEEQLSYVGR